MEVLQITPHQAVGSDPVAPSDATTSPTDDPIGLLPIVDEPAYLCPGERKPVFRSVHLSRLASFFPACRDCPHRDDDQPFSGRLRQRIGSISLRRGHRSLVTARGIRGVYLNDINRATAIASGETIAATLWETRPRRARTREEEVENIPRRPAQRPVVAVGRDSRTSSIEITAGLVAGLRRGGCDVIDLGCELRPALDFAVYHLRTDGGVFITGAGSPQAWTGFEIVDARSIPWTDPSRLNAILSAANPADTAIRSAGALRMFDLTASRREFFQRHAQGLQAIRFGLSLPAGVSLKLVRALLGDALRLAVELPELPDLPPGEDLTIPRRVELRKTIRDAELAFAIRIHEDGQTLTVFDEFAHRLTCEDWTIRLVEYFLPRTSASGVAVARSFPPVARGRLSMHSSSIRTLEDDDAALAAAVTETETAFAIDGNGRLWHRDHFPVCDALLTLQALLRLFTATGQPVSHWR